MGTKKSQSRQYKTFSYKVLQKKNSVDRDKLPREKRIWLKEKGYSNVGWDNVIKLHEKITDLLEQIDLEDSSLEDLFLEADRIGNKYQTPEEVETFQEAMAQEAEAISDTIDRQFPQTEVEMIDFSQPNRRKSKSGKQQKSYRTVSS
jgi:hypothetical protein